jgi:stage II sporulation protein AA (anti-sigma F factor antagonist)
MEFTCAGRRVGRHFVAAVAGDIDLAIHPRFQAEADAWADSGTDVILDCSGVTFMDSMGLRVLVRLQEAVVEAGHAFYLAEPSRPVLRVLELACVLDLFETAGPAQDADVRPPDEVVSGDAAP